MLKYKRYEYKVKSLKDVKYKSCIILPVTWGRRDTLSDGKTTPGYDV